MMIEGVNGYVDLRPLGVLKRVNGEAGIAKMSPEEAELTMYRSRNGVMRGAPLGSFFSDWLKQSVLPAVTGGLLNEVTSGIDIFDNIDFTNLPAPADVPPMAIAGTTTAPRPVTTTAPATGSSGLTAAQVQQIVLASIGANSPVAGPTYILANTIATLDFYLGGQKLPQDQLAYVWSKDNGATWWTGPEATKQAVAMYPRGQGPADLQQSAITIGSQTSGWFSSANTGVTIDNWTLLLLAVGVLGGGYAIYKYTGR